VQPVSRWAEITRWLETEGRLDVVDVAARLGVAQETIRRDLRSLEEQGQLHRVHGGAVPLAIHALPSGSVAPAEPAGSDDLELLEALWAWLPRDGTVLLGAGRLTTDLARVIVGDSPPSKGLTIVTNSLDAAIVLSRAATVSVYNIGGTVNSTTRAQEGDWALQDLNRLHTDVSVVCPAGISVAGGLSQATPAAAAVSESEVRCGRKVIALVDSSALGSSAFVQFATLDQVDQIAVTGFPDTSLVQPFVDRGVRVLQTPAMS
jgi:DeoR family transcriptional regulator, fructose operon transcriptional repressor